MSDNILTSIEILRDKLNKLIEEDHNSLELYTLSTELDELITKYYTCKYINH